MNITIKSNQEIATLRTAGRFLAEVMALVEKKVQVGVETRELDAAAEESIVKFGGRPSFKGYSGGSARPFPATLCVSVNEEVVHGIPGARRLVAGDLVKIDMGMEYHGLFVDMARTFAVGKISPSAEKILAATRESLEVGIVKLRAGAQLSDYSKAVQAYVESCGFAVIRSLVGHGVGYAVHEDPQIPNYYNRNYNEVKLKAGMVLALEPMVNIGGHEIILGKDGWTFKTKDGQLSAHFEDTVAITENGAEILTRL